MRTLVASLALFGGILLGAPGPARADGCTVLLCLAGNWRNISQCVPPVRQALRDLARGRGFPSCGMGGGSAAAGTGAGNRAVTIDECPGPYLIEESFDGTFQRYLCTLSGVVEVTVQGQLWTRTYWTGGGDSITEYMPAAKAQLGEGNYDRAFDDLMASWRGTAEFERWNCRINSVCPPPPPETGGGG